MSSPYYGEASSNAKLAQSAAQDQAYYSHSTAAPTETLQNLTGRSLERAQSLVQALRQISGQLFPPTPEVVPQPERASGPPTVQLGLEVLGSTLDEGCQLAHRILSRL